MKKKIHIENLTFISNTITCSAHWGARSSMAWAALLFRVAMAAANGVTPCRSKVIRSMLGSESKSEMIPWCWFSMAMCSADLPSASWNEVKVKGLMLSQLIVPFGSFFWNRIGSEGRRQIMPWCWFSVAMCNAEMPSASCKEGQW